MGEGVEKRDELVFGGNGERDLVAWLIREKEFGIDRPDDRAESWSFLADLRINPILSVHMSRAEKRNHRDKTHLSLQLLQPPPNLPPALPSKPPPHPSPQYQLRIWQRQEEQLSSQLGWGEVREREAEGEEEGED